MNDSSGQPLSLGSGFFVSSGIIATNAHVIEGASSGTARLVGSTETMQILGTVAVDLNADLALLRVNGSAPSLAITSATTPAVGDNVYVVGNPLGLEGTFSSGIISGARHVEDDSILQMTAPISPGSSGGPVMDSSGSVIGIAEATFGNGQNLNFAVPASYLSRLLASVSKQTQITPLAQQGQGGRSKAPMLDAVAKGDARSHHLAKIEQQGEALYKDARYAEAAPLLDQACTGGSVDACSFLGSMYEKGNGVTKDYSKAATLFSKSCDAGNADGCNGLGLMYGSGRGVAKDDYKAFDLYNKACDAGNPGACSNLGSIYQDALAVNSATCGNVINGCRNYAMAVSLYSKACDAGFAEGCSNLGRMYLNGWGVTEDSSQALMLYSRACNSGDAYGCSGVGLVYQEGYGVQKDKAKAREFYSKGCGMGNQLGCSRLKKMH